MSYNFYSLVSSIKDKSSQAMATLSSDLKEFTSIVQEDVAEVTKTVRKTVHEQSEALRQRVEEQQQLDDEDHEAEGEEVAGDEDASAIEPKKEAAGDNDDAPIDDDTETTKAIERRSSITSMFSFASLSLESVGSKILQSADGLLDTLARVGAVEGEIDEEEGEGEEDDDDKLASARRYRLLALQEDEDTYIHPPMDLETFKKWRKALAEGELGSIQEEVLAHYPTVAQKLAELVPDSVSVDDFWSHYIYKVSLLAAQEQRGADLLEHALSDSDDEVGWDAESPRQASEQDDGFPTYDDASADEALPILEATEMPEPSSPAPVLGEHRRVLHDEDDDDSPAPIDSVPCDNESWIELDEQRKDAQQPPLSSSSTSSFVPVNVPRDGVYDVVAGDSKAGAVCALIVSTPARVREDDEEDADWGDEEESDAAASAKPPGEMSAAIETTVRGPDWEGWD